MLASKINLANPYLAVFVRFLCLGFLQPLLCHLIINFVVRKCARVFIQSLLPLLLHLK